MAIRPWFVASKITSRKHLITVTMLSFWTFYFVSNYMTFNSPIPVAFYPLLALILRHAPQRFGLVLKQRTLRTYTCPKGIGGGGRDCHGLGKIKEV